MLLRKTVSFVTVTGEHVIDEKSAREKAVEIQKKRMLKQLANRIDALFDDEDKIVFVQILLDYSDEIEEILSLRTSQVEIVEDDD